MTLILGIIRQDYVWQSSDNRVSVNGKRRDDDSIKHVSLRCSDGTGLLSYTGLAEIEGMTISDWIRKLLHGETRTLEQSLVLITQEATKEVSDKHELIILIGTFVNKSAWLYQISNVQGRNWRSIDKTFSITKTLITKPECYALGSGRYRISSEDMALLEKIKHKHPRKPEDFLNVLIGINERTAKHDIEKVGESCVAVAMPAKGEPFSGIIHDPNKLSKKIRTIPLVLFGIDTTDMMSDLMSKSAKR